jgi:hypothetical protein
MDATTPNSETLTLMGSPPLNESVAYTFTLVRDTTKKHFELNIPSFQYNEFDDYGHASRPEQEQWMNELFSELKIPGRYLAAGLWELESETDLMRIRDELLRRLRPAPPST